MAVPFCQHAFTESPTDLRVLGHGRWAIWHYLLGSCSCARTRLAASCSWPDRQGAWANRTCGPHTQWSMASRNNRALSDQRSDLVGSVRIVSEACLELLLPGYSARYR